ncbi:ATP phosphoribosyltransferase [Paraliomyxa miuraensis]|uniref:ATP phosphoribosyltransferase n=1 Tax=Paraliomyxa miuraensis TaxID=376150 RepID=UPI00224E1A5B|nr:ATP phosphoribosyltransferase [Paraliomyxa miuraensis]
MPVFEAALTLALPKGRILAPALELLAAAGVDMGELREANDRRLMFALPGGGKALLVKPSDVPAYVEHGVADVGIAGSDTLREQGHDLYEPVDLGIGACRLAVAEPMDRPARLRRGMELRVATKYPNLARRHYSSKGISPEIIPLYGSVELGAITGLADQIVDLVESGETLRQNRLAEVETIMHVTSRLIVHPASLKLKPGLVARVIDGLRLAVHQVDASAGTRAGAANEPRKAVGDR